MVETLCCSSPGRRDGLQTLPTSPPMFPTSHLLHPTPRRCAPTTTANRWRTSGPWPRGRRWCSGTGPRTSRTGERWHGCQPFAGASSDMQPRLHAQMRTIHRDPWLCPATARLTVYQGDWWHSGRRCAVSRAVSTFPGLTCQHLHVTSARGPCCGFPHSRNPAGGCSASPHPSSWTRATPGTPTRTTAPTWGCRGCRTTPTLCPSRSRSLCRYDAAPCRSHRRHAVRTQGACPPVSACK